MRMETTSGTAQKILHGCSKRSSVKKVDGRKYLYKQRGMDGVTEDEDVLNYMFRKLVEEYEKCSMEINIGKRNI